MKKRVLIVNKFLYPRGGDCIVALDTCRMLRSRGHEAALWGMDCPGNLPAEFSEFFASRVSFSGAGKLRGFARAMGYAGVRRRFGEMLRRFRPDVVHFHNIHSYLSPAVVEMAHEFGARTLWTMHDYKLVCPAYTCLRDGRICTDCLQKSSAVVRHRCMKGSLAAGIAARAEAAKWNIVRLMKATDVVICPSRCMARVLEQGGVPPEKIAVVGNCVAFVAPVREKEDYYASFVRLSPEKGIEQLLRVASTLPFELRVYGSGPLEAELKAKYGSCPSIRFMGQTDHSAVAEAMAAARLTVMPSVWLENNPLAVMESLTNGTPVAGANIGGIPELIGPGDGVLFNPSDDLALSWAIKRLFTSPDDYQAIRSRALDRFSPERYVAALESLF